MVEDLTFNLLNDVNVAQTEERLAKWAADNAGQIATNQHKLAMEALSQTERDDVERRARAERKHMIEEAERVERAEETRVRAELVDALARTSGGPEAAREITERAARAKAARAAALAATVPPSLAALYSNNAEIEQHAPTSPSYAGPYVAIPHSDPDAAAWSGWYDLQDDYADGRSGVIWAKEDRESKVKAGGWNLGLFWEMEVRSAVEGLACPVLR